MDTLYFCVLAVTLQSLLMKPLLKPARQVTRGGKSVKLAFTGMCYGVLCPGPCVVFLQLCAKVTEFLVAFLNKMILSAGFYFGWFYMTLNCCIAIYVTFPWHSRSNAYKKVISISIFLILFLPSTDSHLVSAAPPCRAPVSLPRAPVPLRVRHDKKWHLLFLCRRLWGRGGWNELQR